MIELATRVPVQLTPAQSLLVLAAILGLLLAVVLGGVLDALLRGVVTLVLRLGGHRPPERSSMDRTLDELEVRLQLRGDEPRPPDSPPPGSPPR